MENCSEEKEDYHSADESPPRKVLEQDNTFQGTCLLCKSSVKKVDELLELSSCRHALCRKCLQNAIETQRGEIQVACPVSDGETKCPGFLAHFEVKTLVSPEGYVEYLDRSVEMAKKSIENVACCKGEKCDFWCEFEQGRKMFLCPKCSEINCIQCQAIHVGVDCQTYKMLVEQGDRAKLEHFLDKGRKTGWDKIRSSKRATGCGDENGNDMYCSLDVVLGRMEQLSLLTNPFTFQCPVCFDEDVPIGNGIILHECLHMFCKECLAHVVEYCEEATVKCPYREGDYSCVCNLQPREIKEVRKIKLVSDEVHEKHLRRLSQLAEIGTVNSFHCKTPDCPEWCEYEEGATIFKCSTCQKDNCIPCNAIHSGTCEDYRASMQRIENDELSSAAVKKLIEDGEVMRCPKCGILVQKTEGCDGLRCTCCGTEICWATKGPRWGPNGRGDTSGGCKCGVNYNRCHPNCQNCH